MKRLIIVIIALLFLVASTGYADWRYNPFTGKLDWYMGAGDSPTFLSPLTITEAGGDTLVLLLDGSDAFAEWSDGTLFLQTDEADSNSYVAIRPNGTGARSYLELYDTNSIALRLFTTATVGSIEAPLGDLRFQNNIVQDITCWSTIASGNPSLILYGWNTAGSDRESTELIMDDANDEFLIQAANSGNHEGITVSLPQADQTFRIRDASAETFSVVNDGYVKAGSLSGALADNATFATTIPDSWTGIVIVQNITDTTSGVYHLDGTAITAINQNAAFTVTQGTNDKTNVYVAGNVLTVENTWAAAKTVRVMFIGT